MRLRCSPDAISCHGVADTSSDNMSSSKGAAEEPKPEPDDASSSSPRAASYDPSIYQPAHPDDRGGGSGKKKSAVTKPRTKSTKTAKSKTKDIAGDGTHRCANCDKPGAKSKCSRCGVEWYCGRECQKVRGMGR